MNILLVTIEHGAHAIPSYVSLDAGRLRDIGHTVSIYSFRGHRSLRNYLRARRDIRALALGADLIHAHHGQAGCVSVGAGQPVVLTVHGSDLLGIVGHQGREPLASVTLAVLTRIAALAADEVIAVSPALARRVPRQCHVIPGGVDLERFRPADAAAARRTLDLPPAETPLVLFAGGQNQSVKRLDLAERIVHRLAHTGAQLVVPDRVPHDRMPAYMNACDALLVTSEHEGSPTMVKEALACNLPVVSFDVGDVRDRLRGIDGCCVVSDRNLDAMTDGLASVISRRAKINGQGCVHDFDARRMTQRVVDVYERALRRRHDGRAHGR
jgi:glycosyltransferase involved in cell wall biosynthesis